MNKSDQNTLESIRRGDSDVLTQLYKVCFPSIKNLVVKNSGRVEDAEDIFQEAMVVLYRKIKDNSIVLNCALSTYIYSVCRNMWLDKLRRKNRKIEVTHESEDYIDLEAGIVETIHQNEKFALYQKHFRLVGADCQKLLSFFFEGKSMNYITQQMGYGSESYARKRKFECKEKLIKNIKNDILYAELNPGNTIEEYTIN